MDPKAITRKLACKPCVGRLVALLFLFALAAVGLAGCDGNDPTGTDLTTSTEGAQVGPTASLVTADAAAASSPTASATTGTLPLPMYQSASSSEPLFHIVQKGGSVSGRFTVDNPANSFPALYAQTNGTGHAVQGVSYGKGIGGQFSQANSSSGSDALKAETAGSGNAVYGRTTGIGRAGFFENAHPANSNSALAVRTMGSGTAGVFLAPNGGKGMFINSKSNDNTLEAQNYGTGFAAKFYGSGSAKGVYIQTAPGVAGLQVVGGSKNAVVHTPSGAKALYTEESTEVWFTDYGFGKLANGRARVLLDPSFAQTINPDERYHVFLQAHGRGELYVTEMTPLGFEVALNDGGDANAEFSYRIVAKRLGFEGKRLEAAPWADHPPAQD
jgi:hypothetical protein